MQISSLLNDKSLKPKAKTETLSQCLLDGSLSLQALISFAEESKEPAKATCMEAIEFATKQKPSLANAQTFMFAIQNLQAKAPRLKWESAKVIANTAHLFTAQLEEAIHHLISNSEHSGTVVRWSAALALGEILKLKSKHNNDLLPAIEAICKREEKNSIKKIYLDAIIKTLK